MVARTDARQVEGMDGVVARCRAYVEAGADAVFPEALLGADEFRRARHELDVPLVTDIPEWGRSPTMTIEELSEWGFDLGIFAVSTMRVALFAVRAFLDDLAEARTQRPWLDRMIRRDELDDLLGLADLRRNEERLARTGAETASSARGP